MEKRYSGRRRRHLRWLWLLMIPVLAAAGYTLWRFGPQRSYTARQLGLTDLQSPNDADGDGVDDWTDVVLGARAYIATDPHYQSKYYAGGYPDDGLGVCTDVIWQAFQRREGRKPETGPRLCGGRAQFRGDRLHARRDGCQSVHV